MNHIPEHTIETLFVFPEGIGSEEKRTIELHLSECALCKERYDALQRFYDSFDKHLAEPPSERDKAFASSLTGKKLPMLRTRALVKKRDDALDTYVEIIEPYRRPLPQRIIRFVRIHPVKTVGGFSLAAALVFAAISFVRPVKDTNPSYARAKNEFLIVYNKEGEEVWRKHIGVGFDFDTFRKHRPDVMLNNFMAATDVDKDGKNEVIASYGVVENPLPTGRNAIVCYTFDGRERWKYEFNRKMTFGTEEFSNDYIIGNMMVRDFEKDGTIDIVGVFGHIPYYPWAIVRLDAKKGMLLNEYWNPGACGQGYHGDIDGDGIEELLFAGTNNGLNAASLLVLDPRKMSGYAPSPPAYTPVGVEKGMEKYYILLPQSDLSKVGPSRRNYVHDLRLTSDNLLLLQTAEIQSGDHKPGILYFFDTQMRCVRVDGNDYFVQAHKLLEDEGKLSKKLTEQYYDELRKSVQYWDGEKFVNEPTMNKVYLELSKRLP
jgi:hypothetical protein